MALDDIQTLRLLIGDTPTSPFYQLFDDLELQQFLDLNNSNIFAATRMAAIYASFQLAGWSTRERTGNIEVWSDLSSNYLKALGYLINSPMQKIPNGLMPWAGGMSKVAICATNHNPDIVQSPLNNIVTCDYDNPCTPSGNCNPLIIQI